MSNTEWKKGYEEGFAAGWKAAAKQDELNHKNFPPVYYGGYKPGESGNYAFATMADTPSFTTGYSTTLNETRTIRNLTDHTRIV